jgi:hypothetical protein
VSSVSSPPGLLDLQRWMATLILEHRGHATDDIGEDSAIERWIAIEELRRARLRLGAYVGGYPARIHEALCEAYPALRHVIGEGRFRALVDRYRSLVPAGSYSLADVGTDLPSFLVTDEIADRFGFAPDLARLEWAVQAAFHATLGVPLDPSPLAVWTPEQWEAAVFEFRSDLAFVDSRWPIVDVWNVREVAVEEIDVDLRDRSQSALVHRSGFGVVCRVAPVGEASALETLIAGASLGDAIADLDSADDEMPVSPADVMEWFAGWMRDGLIVACHAAA